MPRSALRELIPLKQRPLTFLASRCSHNLRTGQSAPWPANAWQSTSSSWFSSPTTNRSMSTARPIRHRLVVSSFLCVGEPHTESFRVSVFKRSGLVRSFQHKWGACSGSIEESDPLPRDAALREILEETTIGADQLELLAEGKEKDIVDENIGTRWTIYPFLWRWTGDKNIEGGDKWAEGLRKIIKLDWEHTDVQVVPIEEVEKMDTVADLSGTIKRTLMSIKL